MERTEAGPSEPWAHPSDATMVSIGVKQKTGFDFHADRSLLCSV